MENKTCAEEVLCTKKFDRIYIPRPEDMLDPQQINPTFYSIVVTHVITCVFGFVGNTVVIFTWAGSKPSRSPTCTFLVSLAVADLLLLTIYVPLETLEYFVITWDAGGTVCKLSSYVEMLSGMSSVLNLTAVSFERFLVITYPILARRICTIHTCRIGLVVVWLLALVLAAPVLVTKKIHPMTYHNNVTSITAYYCWDTNDELGFAVAVYQLIVMFALPAVLMSCFYFFVIRELWSSTKTVAAMTRPNGEKVCNVPCCRQNHFFFTNRQERAARNRVCSLHRQGLEIQQARKQVIKMLILVIILFLGCWGPRLIMHVAIKRGLENFTMTAYNARVSVYLLSFIHSALNPVVYGFMSTNFRKLMMQSCFEDAIKYVTCHWYHEKYQHEDEELRSRKNLSDTYEFSTHTTSVRRSKLANSVDVDDAKLRKSEEQWTAV